MSAITMPCPAGLEKLNEKQWQAQVVEAAQHHKWYPMHIRNMIGNKAGWPDLLLLREDTYLLLELKTVRGRVGAAQANLALELAWYGVPIKLIWATCEDWDWLQTALR